MVLLPPPKRLTWVRFLLLLPNFKRIDSSMEEQLPLKQLVEGSSPSRCTNFQNESVAQLAEQRAFNSLVVGSTPARFTNFGSKSLVDD
jgi:hypothetical protein